MDIDELRAREQIRDTISRYNHAGDRGRLDELAACFAEDGVLEIAGTGEFEGRAAIIEQLKGVVAEGARASERPRVFHHVSSVKIELANSESASAYSYFLVFTEIGLDHWGRYADRFERRGGDWKLAHRRVRVQGATPNSRMAREFQVER